jgi:hypothetical protein
MNGFVEWIAAQADEEDPAENEPTMPEPDGAQADQQSPGESSTPSGLWHKLPTHDFPARPPELDEARLQDDPLDRNPDLWLYRKRTIALLRRYMRLSIETGRLPSVIGRELFRAKITTYTATTFEDRVIFVHDVEKCLDRLAPFDQKIIARIVLQEYDHERAARVLHCARKTIERRLPEVLDELSEEFLKVRMLVPLPARNRNPDDEG